MPLTLVTGPANAAKAGAVLGRLRDRLDERPVLVLPAFEDIEHAQRELAAHGAVFGARVLRSSALFGLIAERVGLVGRTASAVQRRMVMDEAIAGARLDVLAASSDRHGFADAALRFVVEIERSMIEPARLTQALRQWAGDGPRRGHAEEVARLYSRYRDRLEAYGLADDELSHWRALDGLRRDPAAWGSSPVFLYGFDDLTPHELDALEILSRLVGVEVTVSLPYQGGREAFRAIAGTRERVAELADAVEQLHATDDHYDPASRTALHALERGLYREQPEPASAGEAVRMHVAGGTRAEIELCGAEVLALLRDGTPAGEIAVVLREPGAYASTLEQVFGAYGIPYSIDHRVPLRRTGLGRGLLALLRCAAGEGTAEDLLAYLRVPGRLRVPALADRLEAAVRREGGTSAAAARALWEGGVGPFPLTELDRLARALDRPAALLAALTSELDRLFVAPHIRRAPVLRGAELDDARAYRAAAAALADLRAVAGSGPGWRAIHDTLAELGVRLGEGTQPDRVAVATPEAIRARRFVAVFVCGLQEREFPRQGRPEPFLSDADRRELARASGARLPERERELERERYLFYVCVSRAERLLVLSSRYCGEEGEAEARSFLLDDVERVLPDLTEHARRRTLGEVIWSPREAPTEAEWERAVVRGRGARAPAPIGPLEISGARAALRSRGAVSAGAIERFAGCPVRWLVEDILRPLELEPDPEQMIRGAYAHRVLELTYVRLLERRGSRQVTPANIGAAEAILLEALEQEADRYVLSPQRSRVRAAVRRLEFELLRHLRHEASVDSAFEPEHHELTFGLEQDGYPEVELAGGLRVRGKIDRVDRDGDRVIVRDYKSGRVGADYGSAGWIARSHLQAPLYMRAVESLLGVRAVAGLYTPLGGPDRRPRGLVLDEAVADLGEDLVDNDVGDHDQFEQRLAEADAGIEAAARGMGSGELASCPATCAYRGGCAHPSICRLEA